MIKDITGIKLSGANFGEEVSLQLFTNDKGTRPSENCRICNLYGKNGSGKSTIAHAFSKIIGNIEDNIKTAQIIGKDENAIVLTEREKSESIFLMKSILIKMFVLKKMHWKPL